MQHLPQEQIRRPNARSAYRTATVRVLRSIARVAILRLAATAVGVPASAAGPERVRPETQRLERVDPVPDPAHQHDLDVLATPRGGTRYGRAVFDIGRDPNCSVRRRSTEGLDETLGTGIVCRSRCAAWEGRFADPVAHYRAAARLRADDHVVWAAMGNVLWSMRRRPEAAQALEGAATLLVRAGALRAASELVAAVGRIGRLPWKAAQRQSG